MKVSVICPCSRPNDLPNLHQMFDAQDYEDKELIVINGEGSIGSKRNKACDIATGEVIIHFDSDDLYSSDFITQSVNHLLSSKADVTGLSQAYFYQREPEGAWLYDYAGKQPYVIGSGMCYYKSVWERNKFKDVNSGEDRLFLGNAGKIIPHNYITGFTAFIHGNNTESHKGIRFMKPISPEYVKNAVGFK